MEAPRWDLIAASVIIGVGMVVSALIVAPNRYEVVRHSESAVVRLDLKSGEMISCGYVEQMQMQCREVWSSTEAEREIDKIASDTRNELAQ